MSDSSIKRKKGYLDGNNADPNATDKRSPSQDTLINVGLVLFIHITGREMVNNCTHMYLLLFERKEDCPRQEEYVHLHG